MFTFVTFSFRIFAISVISGGVGLLDLDELANVQYAIDILDKPLLINENTVKGGVVLSSKYGQLYWCQYEVITSSDIAGPEVDNVAKTDVIELLKPMEDEPCLLLNTGWWTYDLCYKKELRQYHLEEGKILGDIISLGHFASEFNWYDTRLKSRPEYAGRYHSQEYTNGSVCDLTGDFRSTSVMFKCQPGVIDGIDSVEEPATCTYIVTVHTSRICRHPGLKILSQKKSVPITCQPLLNDEEYAYHIEYHSKYTTPVNAGHHAEKSEVESTAIQPGIGSAQKESILIMAEATDSIVGTGEDYKQVLLGTIVKKLKNNLATDVKEETQAGEEEEEEQKIEKGELYLEQNEKEKEEHKEEILIHGKADQKQENPKPVKITDVSDELNDALNGILSVVSSELKTLVVKTDDEDEDEEEEEVTDMEKGVENSDVKDKDSDTLYGVNSEATSQKGTDESTSKKSSVTEADEAYLTWQGQGNQVQQITINTGMKVHVKQLQKDNKEDEDNSKTDNDQNVLTKAKLPTKPSRKMEVRIINAAYYNKDGKPVSVYGDDPNPSIERMVIALLQRNDEEVAEFEKQKQIEANYQFKWSKTNEKKSESITNN